MLWGIFSCTRWPPVYFLCRNVYSSPLTFFNLIVFLLLSCTNSLYILDSRLLHIYDLQIVFPILECFLHLIISFGVLISKIWSPIYLFSFVASAFGDRSENSLPNPKSRRFILMHFSKCSMFLALIFMSLIYFELIFVYDVRSSVILLHVHSELSQHHMVNRLVHSSLNDLDTFVEINCL